MFVFVIRMNMHAYVHFATLVFVHEFKWLWLTHTENKPITYCGREI